MTTTTPALVLVGRGRSVHAGLRRDDHLTNVTNCGAETHNLGLGAAIHPAYGATEITCKRCLKSLLKETK